MSSQAPAHTAGLERRSRLRAYQVQLLERVQAAKTGLAASSAALGVLIGERHYLLDLTQITEILELPGVTPVPLTRDWYLGLTNIRGNLTGVIDLARYQGYSAANRAASHSRLVTFAPALGLHCALLVERVLGLHKLTEMQAVRHSTSTSNSTSISISNSDSSEPVPGQHYVDGEGRNWRRIDLVQLVGEARFLQVGV